VIVTTFNRITVFCAIVFTPRAPWEFCAGALLVARRKHLRRQERGCWQSNPFRIERTEATNYVRDESLRLQSWGRWSSELTGSGICTR
jgi:hypothetical protein